MRFLPRIALAFVLTYFAALVAWYFVSPDAPIWYGNLEKPHASLPESSYFLSALVTYFFAAIALCFIWLKTPDTHTTTTWLRFYLFQLVFNAGWFMFFLGYHAIFISLIDAVFTAFIALMLMMAAWEIDKRAVYFFTPYFVWTVLLVFETAIIWYLN